jgi:hypothetical protein
MNGASLLSGMFLFGASVGDLFIGLASITFGAPALRFPSRKL